MWCRLGYTAPHTRRCPPPRDRLRIMSSAIPNLTLPVRTNAWKWWVCGLLLLATMVNYIDRLTLNLMAKPIMTAFDLDPADYGQLESAFGTAFALGAIVM